jgi:hypothetical protein
VVLVVGIAAFLNLPSVVIILDATELENLEPISVRSWRARPHKEGWELISGRNGSPPR